MSTSSQAPALPPKTDSHEASRRSTPIGGPTGLREPALPSCPPGPAYSVGDRSQVQGADETTTGTRVVAPPDPGNIWLPAVLQDKSKQDITTILADASLLHAMTHAATTLHPSLLASHQILELGLAANIEMASNLTEAERTLGRDRSRIQAQLLSTHALERQWRQKQADLDTALSPFSPTSLYQRLCHGVQEQGMICNALEESFLDGNSDGACATERETADWIRRYRDARSLYYQRLERRERWDEGRVGGWR